MPRKGGGQPPEPGWDPVGTRRCRDSTDRGMLGPGLPHPGTHLQTTGGNRCLSPGPSRPLHNLTVILPPPHLPGHPTPAPPSRERDRLLGLQWGHLDTQWPLSWDHPQTPWPQPPSWLQLALSNSNTTHDCSLNEEEP